MSLRRTRGTSAMTARPTAWPGELEEVARSLPAVLEKLRASYAELEARAARVETELQRAKSEKEELSEQLHAADKLSALGTMAAGIAHEIRNPLNAVEGFAELLLAGVTLDEQGRRWAEHIVAGVKDVDQIIDNLLSFATPECLRLEPVEGRELLASAANLVLAGDRRPLSRACASGPITLRAEAPLFRADRIKLRQAVRNLIENALRAQDGSSEPRIEVALAREGPELVVRVADAGPGVPAELRSRILDPFFTTHADGTGLGLALVSTIARAHGGSVQLSPERSELGGALFLLRIPFLPAAERCDGAPRSADGPTAYPQTQRQ